MNTQHYMLLGTLLALGLARQAHCQADLVRPVPTVAFAEGITAQGHSEVKVKPDIALVIISVTTQFKDQAETVAQNAMKTKAVLAALKDTSIADKDIQTQSYTVQPQYDYQANPPALTGYQVQNSVRATVRDLTKVGLVIDKTTQAGASQISDITFDLSNRREAEAQALAMAVVVARVKATVMAQAAGVDLGRLLTMTEGNAPAAQPVYSPMRALAAAPARAETPIADPQITVTADATLVYAMGPAKTP